MNRSVPVNRDLRSVSFKYLGRIRNEMAKAREAGPHTVRGIALDQAWKFLNRIYKKAKNQG
jgi:hypothetical protein